MSDQTQYKQSGIGWIGGIPQHWELDRLKNGITLIKNGVWGDEPTEDGNDIYCVRVADYNRTNMSVNDSNLTNRSIELKDRVLRILENGDLLIERSGGGEKQPVGFVVRFTGNYRAVFSNFMSRLKVSPISDSNFLKYVFKAMYDARLNVKSIKQTTGIQNLDLESYLNEIVPYPPVDEQAMIADFLDNETSKIESLIAKKQRLIELLQEKRQALILNAVTKGLNPNVPMKNSGIAWIGEVPEHWRIDRLKIGISFIKNGVWGNDPIEDGSDIICIRVADYNRVNMSIDESNLTYRSIELKDRTHRILERGDLLVERSGGGERQPVGFVVRFNGDYQAVFSNFMSRLKVSSKATSNFLKYVFRAMYDARLNMKSIKQTTGIQNLDLETYLNECIPYPAVNEQEKIADFLDAETSKFDNLIEKNRRLIDLLNEYRQTLITAAVTGKVDVRVKVSS